MDAKKKMLMLKALKVLKSMRSSDSDLVSIPQAVSMVLPFSNILLQVTISKAIDNEQPCAFTGAGGIRHAKCPQPFWKQSPSCTGSEEADLQLVCGYNSQASVPHEQCLQGNHYRKQAAKCHHWSSLSHAERHRGP